MDGGEDTPRVCDACGGNGRDDEGKDEEEGDAEREPCAWCTAGFQNRRQQRAWARFQRRMRRVSSTYSFVDEAIHELLERLAAENTEEAVDLAHEGTRLIAERSSASASDTRRAATESLSVWHKMAIDYLMARQLEAHALPGGPAAATDEAPDAHVAHPEPKDGEPD